MQDGQESATNRILRLMDSTDPSPRATGSRPAFQARRIGAGAFVAARDVNITLALAGHRGFAEDQPVDRALLVALIELCGNQLGDRRHHLPHMLMTFGTARIERLTDSELQDLADWAYRRAVGRGLAGTKFERTS